MNQENIDNPTVEAFRVLVFFKSAQEHRDVEQMIEHSIDIRYQDDDARRRDYPSLLSQDSTSMASIGKMIEIDNNLVMAQVKFQKDGNCRYLTVPIHRKDGQWKVIMGASV
ncbi:hypothetical protein KM924_09855 [Brevibacillus parabrevis]|uniref:hypothetical protein n=1 Tax=Brevibacillus parabrevis TaxID=54914 RepID=UPI001C229D01|nr:hypothetical protein [Brevibacillus parabrevis]MBU8712804.1 hypothetical protein [Brevibacillus parabrevis]